METIIFAALMVQPQRMTGQEEGDAVPRHFLDGPVEQREWVLKRFRVIEFAFTLLRVKAATHGVAGDHLKSSSLLIGIPFHRPPFPYLSHRYILKRLKTAKISHFRYARITVGQGSPFINCDEVNIPNTSGGLAPLWANAPCTHHAMRSMRAVMCTKWYYTQKRA